MGLHLEKELSEGFMFMFLGALWMQRVANAIPVLLNSDHLHLGVVEQADTKVCTYKLKEAVWAMKGLPRVGMLQYLLGHLRLLWSLPSIIGTTARVEPAPH